MKKQILSSLLCLTSLLAVAQPVITKSAFTPVPGDGYYSTTYNYTPSPSPSAALANWDFSGASSYIISRQDTVLYNPGTSFFSPADYPDCNLFSHGQTFNLYNFYNATDTALYRIGYWAADATSYQVHYFNNKYRELVFPMSLNDTYIDTVTFTDCDTTTAVRNVSYDGYGTLILPFGTYTNTARVRTTTVDSDYCAYSGSTMVPYIYADTVFNYYAPGYHYAVATMYFINNGAKLLYTNQPAPLSVINTATANSITIYPVPTNEQLYINTATSCYVQLYNAVGQLCHSSVYTPGTPLNVAALPNGIYTLRVLNKTTSRTSVHKVVVAH